MGFGALERFGDGRVGRGCHWGMGYMGVMFSYSFFFLFFLDQIDIRLLGENDRTELHEWMRWTKLAFGNCARLFFRPPSSFYPTHSFPVFLFSYKAGRLFGR
jgi:hypothetical protein